jgi:hypothetical protein
MIPGEDIAFVEKLQAVAQEYEYCMGTVKSKREPGNHYDYYSLRIRFDKAVAKDAGVSEDEKYQIPYRSPEVTNEHHSLASELETADWPLPLSVIPNHMGINLCSVEGMSWQKQSDGQLVSLTIHFIPAPPEARC